MGTNLIDGTPEGSAAFIYQLVWIAKIKKKEFTDLQ